MIAVDMALFYEIIYFCQFAYATAAMGCAFLVQPILFYVNWREEGGFY